MSIHEYRPGRRHPDEAELAATLGLVPDGPPASDPDQISVRAHLARCPVCQTRARALRAAGAGLAALAAAEPDELSWRRLERDLLAAWAHEVEDRPGATPERAAGARPAEAGRGPEPDHAPADRRAEAAPVPARNRAPGSAPASAFGLRVSDGRMSAGGGAAPAGAPSWRRRVSAWAAAAILAATATATAAVAVERWMAAPATARASGARPTPTAAAASTPSTSAASPAAARPVPTGEPRAKAAAAPRADLEEVEAEADGAGAVKAAALSQSRLPAAAGPAPAKTTRAADAGELRPVPPPTAARLPDGLPVRPGGGRDAARVAEPVNRPPASGSNDGETSVSVLSRPSPFVRALAAAERAHYLDHDLEATLQHARRARRHAADRAQARRAESIECDALIALGRAEAAVSACARLLDDPNPESVRMTHYTLGSLLRGRLNDCDRARRHFDAAVVFGHSSLYGTDARLQRAHCALAQGDLEQVDRDLVILRQRAGLRDLSAEIERLTEALSRAREAASKPGRSGRGR